MYTEVHMHDDFLITWNLYQNYGIYFIVLLYCFVEVTRFLSDLLISHLNADLLITVGRR